MTHRVKRGRKMSLPEEFRRHIEQGVEELLAELESLDPQNMRIGDRGRPATQPIDIRQPFGFRPRFGRNPFSKS